MGAIAIDARSADPVEQIKEATAGRGVDVALELIGSAKTMRQAVLCLGPLGRAALVGLTAESMSIHPYTELINKEAEIIGVSDHLATEFPALIEFARSGKLRFPPETLCVVDLDAAQINAALDSLRDFHRPHQNGNCSTDMNWEMLAAFGQLAAVVIGIPSLIYLARPDSCANPRATTIRGQRANCAMGRRNVCFP